MAKQNLDNHILVAAIIAPHGVNGAVSAESYSDNPRRFTAGAAFFTEQGQILHLTHASPHKGRLLLAFREISDRNGAEGLRGAKLYIPETDVAPLPDGSYYHYQLIGLTVMEDKRSLGTIRDVLPYTANDIYVMETPDKKEVLIPGLKSVVKKIDLAAGIMEVELPEGL